MTAGSTLYSLFELQLASWVNATGVVVYKPQKPLYILPHLFLLTINDDFTSDAKGAEAQERNLCYRISGSLDSMGLRPHIYTLGQTSEQMGDFLAELEGSQGGQCALIFVDRVTSYLT